MRRRLARTGTNLPTSGMTLVELMIVVVLMALLALCASLVISRVAAAPDVGPVAGSPLGQVTLLYKLVGLAVLLYGAGYWYLSELRRPGGLSDFRWPHFLLLASNYSLFFVAFAVLGAEDERPWLALALSACLSLPLLTLHVSRLADWRFALGRGLPLALSSLGVVLTGVYGGAHKGPISLVAGAAAIAYVTLTYPRWAAGRRRWLERAEARRCQRLRERQAEPARAALEQRAREAALALEALEAGQEDDPLDPATPLAAEEAKLRSRLEAAQRSARALLDEWPLLGHLEDPDEHREAVEQTRLRAVGLAERLERLRDELEAARSRQERRPAPGEAGERHCVHCGRPYAQDFAHCPRCGEPSPLRLACASCGEETWLVTALLVEGWQDARLHCRSCGTELEATPPLADSCRPAG